LYVCLVAYGYGWIPPQEQYYSILWAAGKEAITKYYWWNL
jgi:hypothetical protein